MCCYFDAYIETATSTGNNTLFEYDVNDYLKKVITYDGAVTIYKYDCTGKKIQKIMPNEYDKKREEALGTRYEYDALGRLIKITDAEDNVQKQYIYNEYGEIQKEIDVCNREKKYEYDHKGNRIYEEYEKIKNVHE